MTPKCHGSRLGASPVQLQAKTSQSGPAKKARLTARQRRFCAEYLVDLNAFQAALRAGYSAPTAKNAARWLEKRGIQTHLALLRNAAAVETKVTPERVIAELAKLAFADPRKILDENGDIRPPSEWPDDVAAGVASFDICQVAKDVVVKKVKRWDKTKALELLGRYLAIFKDKVEVDVQTRLEDLVMFANAAKKREGQ